MLLEILSETNKLFHCKTLKNTHLKITKDKVKTLNLKKKTFNTAKIKGTFFECDQATFKSFFSPFEFQEFEIKRFCSDNKIELANGLIFTFEDVEKYSKISLPKSLVDQKIECLKLDKKEKQRQSEKKKLEYMQDNTRARYGGLKIVKNLAMAKDIKELGNNTSLLELKNEWHRLVFRFSKRGLAEDKEKAEKLLIKIRRYEPGFALKGRSR